MKLRILAATTNRGKHREIVLALRGLNAEVLSLENFPPMAPPLEDGRTFLENARKKAVYYSGCAPLPTLAEDSGLEVEHLGGEPGIFSARFAGPKATDARNIAKVLRLLQGVPAEKRRARFACFLVLCRSGEILAETNGIVEGFITTEPKGRSGFGYDPVFFYPPLDRTFAELDTDEKSAVSHRGLALRRMREFLAHRLEEAGS